MIYQIFEKQKLCDGHLFSKTATILRYYSATKMVSSHLKSLKLSDLFLLIENIDNNLSKLIQLFIFLHNSVVKCLN